MKRVDAREFAEHAAEYLAAGEPISVEQDGEVIGRYVPMPPAANGTATNGHVSHGTAPGRENETVRPESRALIERLDQTLQRVYEESGLTEGEFAEFFNLQKPFAFDADAKA